MMLSCISQMKQVRLTGVNRYICIFIVKKSGYLPNYISKESLMHKLERSQQHSFTNRTKQLQKIFLQKKCFQDQYKVILCVLRYS